MPGTALQADGTRGASDYANTDLPPTGTVIIVK